MLISLIFEKLKCRVYFRSFVTSETMSNLNILFETIRWYFIRRKHEFWCGDDETECEIIR